MPGPDSSHPAPRGKYSHLGNPSREEHGTLLLVILVTLYFIFGIVETSLSILAIKRPSVPTVFLAA